MDLEVEDLYEQWRKKLMKACLFLIVLILIVELILFLGYQYIGNIDNIPSYVLIFIVSPNFFNVLAFLIGYYVIRYRDINVSIKNKIPVFIIMCFCSIALIFYGKFSVIVTLFMIPVTLTVIYSNYMFTKWVIVISSIIIGIGFLCAMIQDFYEIDYYLWHYIGAIIIFVIGCIQANELMKYETDIKKMLRKNIAQRQELEEKVKQDPLTGLYTVSAFQDMMKQKVQEGKTPIAILLMCFDYKEAVLEQSLLQDFAQIVKTKSGLHGFSAYCRRGEFVMAFPGNQRQHSQDTVNDIRRALRKYAIASGLGFDMVSFTACSLEYHSKDGETVDEMLHRADQSLRKAQGIGGGRNIVI